MFEQSKYANEYTRQNYDVVRALVPKGKKTVIKQCADEKGVSISALIVRALEETYNISLSDN